MNSPVKIVSSSGNGNFKLFEGDREVYELAYANWFSGKASTTHQGNLIELKPKNIWVSKINIFKNERPIGDITMNLKGHMIIRIENPNGKDFNYILKNKGIWTLRFEVYDEAGTLLFLMTSINNWTKLNYDYDIKPADFNAQIDLKELLIYCGYAANLFVAHMSAA